MITPELLVSGRLSTLSASSICGGVRFQSEIDTVLMSAVGFTVLPKKSTVNWLQSNTRSAWFCRTTWLMLNESVSE